MKYLPLYKKWLEAGEIPKDGLCACFKDSTFWESYMITSVWGYWGWDGNELFDSDLTPIDIKYKRAFTPMRQTVVLFLAAINGEL